MKSNLPTLSSNQVCDLLSLCLMLGAYLVFVVLVLGTCVFALAKL